MAWFDDFTPGKKVQWAKDKILRGFIRLPHEGLGI